MVYPFLFEQEYCPVSNHDEQHHAENFVAENGFSTKNYGFKGFLSWGLWPQNFLPCEEIEVLE